MKIWQGLGVLLFLAACGRGTYNDRVGNPARPAFALATLKEVSIKEMQPLRVVLDNIIDDIDLSPLPEGAIFDQSSQELRWLPQKGQAGIYEVPVWSDQRLRGSLLIEVKALAEYELSNGPFDRYRDGDIGYIYVHGMGQSDTCERNGGAWDGWKKTADILSPDPATRTAVCYDGRDRVEAQAGQVARQIAAAPCGRFEKCLILAHSMGGLMMEYILHNAQEDSAAEDRELFAQIKKRILFVIAAGSAAGGSKLANIVKHPDRYPRSQGILAAIGKLLPSQEAIDNLQIDYATQVAAPITSDPEIPIFSVAGYSKILGINARGFNGRLDLALLDHYADFNSRSDSLVSFRSACGIASSLEDDGPGQKASLSDQLDYCYNAPRKPSHYVWFTINLNHSLVVQPFDNCAKSINGCDVHTYDGGGEGYRYREDLSGKDAVQIMRWLLTKGLGEELENLEHLQL